MDESNRTYTKNTNDGGIKGQLYQIRLCTIILYKALEINNIKQFKLATEMKIAGKFDDLVFEYDNEKGETQHILLQAKHRTNESTKISLQDLFSEKNDPYKLLKYYVSYIEILKKKRTGQIRSIVLFTNVDFDSDVKEMVHHETNDSNKDIFEILMDSLNDGFKKIPFSERKQSNKTNKIKDEKQEKRDDLDKKRKLADKMIFCMINKEKIITTELLDQLKPFIKESISIIDRKVQFNDTFINTEDKIDSKCQEFKDLINSRLQGNSLIERLTNDNDSITTHIHFNIYEEFRSKIIDKKFTLIDLYKHVNSFPLHLKENVIKTECKSARYRFDVIKIGPRLKEKIIQLNNENQDKKISEAHIEDFFNHLIFAVNQPNGDELSKLIENNFSCTENKLNAESITRHVETRMTEWYKDIDGKFLSAQEAKRFVEECKLNINTSVFYNNLNKDDIQFEPDGQNGLKALNNFLIQKPFSHLIEVVPASTISIIRVCQAMHHHNSLKQRYICTNMDDLISSSTELLLLKDVVISFDYFLIIECKSSTSIDNSKMCETLKELKTFLKVVLISESDDVKTNFIKEFFKKNEIYQFEYSKNVGLQNLTKDSQAKILEKTITFQGIKVQLKEITDEKACNFIDSHMLCSLIKNEEIIIGKTLKSSDAIKNDYYINRKIWFNEIDINILKDSTISSLFAFSGIDKDSLSKFLPENSRITAVCQSNNSNENKIDNNITKNIFRYFIIDNDDEFERLFELFSAKNRSSLHWFKYNRAGQFTWKKSEGDITELDNYKVHYTEKECHHKLENTNMVVLLDSAGMGKSEILSKFAVLLKESDPHKWIVRLNMNHYIDKFYEFKDTHFMDLDKVLSFLLDHVEQLTQSFKQLFFKYVLQTRKLIVMLDNYDQMSITFPKLVDDFINSLTSSLCKQVWIATRPDSKLESQQYLITQNVFCKLIPLDLMDQVDLLVKFWTKTIKPAEDLNMKQTFAKNLIQQISNRIGDRESKFLGFPLHLKIVAEVYQDESKSDFLFDGKLSEITLYKTFIFKMFQISWHGRINQNKLDQLKCGEDAFILSKANFFRLHQQFALSTFAFDSLPRNQREENALLSNVAEDEFRRCYPKNGKKVIEQMKDELFENKNIEILSFVKEITTCREQSGLLIRNGQRTEFIHQNFAEYFTAEYFTQIFNNEAFSNILIKKILLKKVLIDSIYQKCRYFIDGCLKDRIQQNLFSEEWSSTINEIRDYLQRNDRNIVSIAAKEGNQHIITLMLNLHRELAEKLINCQYESGIPAVLVAARHKNWNVVELLVQNGADINAQDRNGFRAIYEAILKADVTVVHKMLQYGAELNITNCNGLAPLHLAAKKGRADIVEKLLSTNVDLDAKDKNGTTAVCLAANEKYWNIAKLLALKGADLNIANKYGRSVFVNAIEDANKDIVSFLLQSGVNANIIYDRQTDLTPLHLAVKKKLFDIVKLLVMNKDVNRNARDSKGQTALHHASKLGFHEIAMLLAKGELINAQSNTGQTALHCAAVKNHERIVTLLVIRGADLNAKDKNSSTPLHFAARKGFYGIVDRLISEGAVINAGDIKRRSPVKLAANGKKWDVVELLEKNNADLKNNLRKKVKRTREGSPRQSGGVAKKRFDDWDKSKRTHYVKQESGSISSNKTRKEIAWACSHNKDLSSLYQPTEASSNQPELIELQSGGIENLRLFSNILLFVDSPHAKLFYELVLAQLKSSSSSSKGHVILIDDPVIARLPEATHMQCVIFRGGSELNAPQRRTSSVNSAQLLRTAVQNLSDATSSDSSNRFQCIGALDSGQRLLNARPPLRLAESYRIVHTRRHSVLNYIFDPINVDKAIDLIKNGGIQMVAQNVCNETAREILQTKLDKWLGLFRSWLNEKVSSKDEMVIKELQDANLLDKLFTNNQRSQMHSEINAFGNIQLHYADELLYLNGILFYRFLTDEVPYFVSSLQQIGQKTGQIPDEAKSIIELDAAACKTASNMIQLFQSYDQFIYFPEYIAKDLKRALKSTRVNIRNDAENSASNREIQKSLTDEYFRTATDIFQVKDVFEIFVPGNQGSTLLHRCRQDQLAFIYAKYGHFLPDLEKIKQSTNELITNKNEAQLDEKTILFNLLSEESPIRRAFMALDDISLIHESFMDYYAACNIFDTKNCETESIDQKEQEFTAVFYFNTALNYIKTWLYSDPYFIHV